MPTSPTTGIEGGGPSMSAANGRSTSPPATNCHDVTTVTLSCAVHRLVRTNPVLADVTAPMEARSPIRSTWPPPSPWRTRRRTPSAPTREATMVAVVERSRRKAHASPIVMSGAMAVMVDPSPLGSLVAAMKRKATNRPIVKVPRTTERHHHEPRGRRRCQASMRSPMGRIRMTPANSGRSAGR